jgi:2-oxoisovalerate dehydrogenase E1 component
MESATSRRRVSEEFLRELHGFLSLEAPFLIADLPKGGGASELERHLLSKIEERFTIHPEFASAELYPFVSHENAAAWGRKTLEELVRGFFRRQEIKASITDEERLLLYRAMLLTREVDDFLKTCFDEKRVAWERYPSPQKGFRSTGQEAVVGVALRLRRPPEYAPGRDYRGDIVSPLIRDLGAAMMFMPDPLHPILVQWGKSGTPVGGRDLHVGDFDHGVMPPAAPLAIATQTLVGIAYAFKLRGEDRVCVSFIGDGGSSLGEWHEAINFAAVQKLNMVFVVENNMWALGTHVSEQTAAKRFALKAAGYGIPGVTVFGNDPDEVAAASAWAAERARAGHGPALLELVSYRRSGHAHHDDDRFHGNAAIKVAGYEFDEERKVWEQADPVSLYEERLRGRGLPIDGIREEEASRVAEAARRAEAAPWPGPKHTEDRVYAVRSAPVPPPAPSGRMKKMSYDEAVRQGIVEAMEADERVFVLGEDVGGRYGGAFGVTRGLAKQFGSARCVNAILAESAIVGCGVGAAVAGMRPVVEIQFADFLAPGFNALVNNAAKLHWRWGRAVPLVVRLPYGGATGTMNKLLGGGPFHSQCPEMWFVRTPGWKVVAPSTPADAKGLMLAAIRDDNPVIYLEAKGLYGFFRTDLREEVELGAGHETPLGVAAVRREGKDVTCLTYGAMVWTALEAAGRLEEEGVSLEVIDLRTLVPLDEEAILRSVAKTHRALILHEDTRRGGLAGELAAVIAEKAIWDLDAPIARVTAPDTPVPYSPPLEYAFLPKAEDVVEAAIRLVG